MKVVRDTSSLFHNIAGEQSAFDGKGRMMRYIVQKEVDDGVLLFNTMSCMLLLLDREESASLPTLPADSELTTELRRMWFIVPEDFDEKCFVLQLRDIFKYVFTFKGVSSYTILTTTDCNARCFYCYEKGRSRIPMSMETAGKVARYITRNYREINARKKHDKTFMHLGWFGGEPLYNVGVIDKICQELKDAGVEYRSNMISNAYLFTPEIIERAKTLWHLWKVQVTLDGTEKVYNKIKSFYRVKDSAYQRVMNNIQQLLDAEITVSVRMNLDKHNADDLMLLVDELKERFGGNQYFRCYSHILFSNSDHVSTEEERPLVAEKQEALMSRLYETGLRKEKTGKLPFYIQLTHCMSDSDDSITIAPTGDFGKCEHFTDSDFFSNIDHPEIHDENILRKFSEPCEEEPLCRDCPLVPQCVRIKICPNLEACHQSSRDSRITSLKRQMTKAYERFLNHQQSTLDHEAV